MFYLALIYFISFLFWGEKLHKKHRIFAGMIPFVVIIFLRFGVGADYFAYGEIYYRLDPNNINESLIYFPNVEILFSWLFLLGKYLGIPYHVFTGILSTVMMYITLSWIESYDDNFELSVLLYYTMFFFVWNISAMRQGLSIAILVYIFFNRKKSFHMSTKVLVSFIMLFVHSSSIIVLILYLLSQLKWTKKAFITTLVLGLLVSLIPFESILGFLETLPILNKVTFYIDAKGPSILSFASIMRLGLFSFVFYYYDRILEEEKISRTTLNFVLLSFITYFYLSFSTIISARISIYGYLIMILIIPSILSFYEHDYRKMKIVLLSIIAFTLVSFYKEYSTMASQSEYNNSLNQLNFETIFSKNYNNFDKGYGLSAHIREIQNAPMDIDERINKSYSQVEAQVSETDTYLSVYFPKEKLYGIINQKGEVVELPTSTNRNNTFKNYTDIIFNPDDFPTVMYRVIGSEKLLGYWEMEEVIEEWSKRDLMFKVHWTQYEDITTESVKDIGILKDINMNAITSVKTANNDFYPDYTYVTLVTPVTTYTLVQDKDKKFSPNMIFNYYEMYNEDKIAVGYTDTDRYYINENGDIIWKEELNIPKLRLFQ